MQKRILLSDSFFFLGCRLIDDEQPKYGSRGTYGWERYYNLHDIYSWLDQMLEQYPNSLTNYNFGTSYENRTIRAVKLSMKKVQLLGKKKCEQMT